MNSPQLQIGLVSLLKEKDVLKIVDKQTYFKIDELHIKIDKKKGKSILEFKRKGEVVYSITDIMASFGDELTFSYTDLLIACDLN